MSDVWGEISLGYDRTAARHLFLYANDAIGLLAPKEDDYVLDVGCGTGDFARSIAQYVRHVHAIDLSRGMINLAKTKSHSPNNVSFEACDICDLVSGKKYTIVTAFFCLMLMSERGVALRRMRDVAAPGARIAVTSWVEAANSPAMRLFERAMRAAGVGTVAGECHVTDFNTREQITSELANAGFRNILHLRCSYPIEAASAEDLWNQASIGSNFLYGKKRLLSASEWQQSSINAIAAIKSEYSCAVSVEAPAWLTLARAPET
jgi:ubiquinone/menaquinone biosynthesis C-methylase UbiE